MKIPVTQLAAQLKKQLPPIIWLTGDEPLQLLEASDLIRQQAKSQGILEREIYEANAQFEWKQLLDISANLSLFGDQRLIEVRLTSNKPGKSGSEVIQKLCEQATDSPDVFFFTSPKLDSAQNKSSWVNKLEKTGLLVQVWPVEARQLPQWIQQRLQQTGIQAQPEAIQLLAERVEGNLLAAAQEIEKLRLFVQKDEQLTAERLLSLIEDASRYSPFDLADACLAGDIRRAVRILHGLQAEGIEAPLLLWALSREIRLLEQLLYQQSTGQPFDVSCRQLGIWDKRKPLYQQASQRLTLQHTHQLLQRAQGCDLAIKGSGESLPDLLLSLVTGACGRFQ